MSNKKHDIDLQRRLFLANVGRTISYFSALSALPHRNVFAAMDRLKQRRHLVTIQATGDSGWDAQNFHMSMNHALLDPANEVTQAKSEGDSRYWEYTRRDVEVNGSIIARHFPHPNYGNDAPFLMGPGMSIFSEAELAQDLLIWGGSIWADGGHGVAVKVYNSGLRSQYAAGFSSVIAADMAKKYPRKLQYVQLAGMGSVRTDVGLVGANGEPINIPDLKTWRALTIPPAEDGLAGVQDKINSALRELVSFAQSNRLKKSTSKDTFEAFLASVTSAREIGVSKFAEDGSEFMELFAEYQAEIASVINEHPFGRRVYEFTGNWYGSNQRVESMAFRFALAEFLIRKDYSGVVDIAAPFSDAHGNNRGEAAMLLINFAGMRKLIRNLKATELPGGGGKSLYDITTLAMYTEWDRTPHLSYSGVDGRTNPGTGHGATASVVFAGAGIYGGRVVGGLMHDPNIASAFAPYSELTVPAGGTVDRPMIVGRGLPIDFKTGQVSPSGEYTWIENMFPTMCSIFGVGVPQQQLTAYGPIPAIRKG